MRFSIGEPEKGGVTTAQLHQLARIREKIGPANLERIVPGVADALNLTTDLTIEYNPEQFDNEWGAWEARNPDQPKPESRRILTTDYELQDISDDQYDGRQYIQHSEIPEFARILGNTATHEERARIFDEEYQHCIRQGNTAGLRLSRGLFPTPERSNVPLTGGWGNLATGRVPGDEQPILTNQPIQEAQGRARILQVPGVRQEVRIQDLPTSSIQRIYDYLDPGGGLVPPSTPTQGASGGVALQETTQAATNVGGPALSTPQVGLPSMQDDQINDTTATNQEQANADLSKQDATNGGGNNIQPATNGITSTDTAAALRRAIANLDHAGVRTLIEELIERVREYSLYEYTEDDSTDTGGNFGQPLPAHLRIYTGYIPEDDPLGLTARLRE